LESAIFWQILKSNSVQFILTSKKFERVRSFDAPEIAYKNFDEGVAYVIEDHEKVEEKPETDWTVDSIEYFPSTQFDYPKRKTKLNN
jgi:hypothetical protein